MKSGQTSSLGLRLITTRRFIVISLFTFLSLVLGVQMVQRLKTETPPSIRAADLSRPIIVDHTSVALFDQIPSYYLDRAKNLRMLFSNRSVGVNINQALNCLEWPNNNYRDPVTGLRTPNYCRVWNHHDDRYDVDPSEVNWNVPGGLNRDNWRFGIFASDWRNMTSEFITALQRGNITLNDGAIGVPSQNILHNFNDLDAISFQFSYLNIDGGNIGNQLGGFVSHNPGANDDIYDLDSTFESLYPNKFFIYMTTSLARGLGSQAGTDVNNGIRQFVQANNRVLLDVADIESHDPSGQPCYDNRDGVQYCNSGGVCENYADDGVNQPAICQHYTTETDGGHLGSTSGGSIRIAKAFWVLMAQIAGWEPGATQVTQYPTVPPATATSVPSAPPNTPTPTLPVVATVTPTPTTPVGGSLTAHIGDLDTYIGGVAQTGYWQGALRAYVHDVNHRPVVGAIVKAVVNGGSVEYACLNPTNNTGFCNLYSPMQAPAVTSVTFSVTNIMKDGHSYSPSSNHDVDGGTDGISAILGR